MSLWRSLRTRLTRGTDQRTRRVREAVFGAAFETREEVAARWAVRLALLVFVVGSLFPIYVLFSIAFTPSSYVWTDAGLVPPLFSTEGFELALRRDWVAAFTNSIVIAGGATLLVLAVAIPASYAFGRIAFPGRWPLFLAVLSLVFFPRQAVAIPLYDLFTTPLELFGLTFPSIYDTHAAIILPVSTFSLPLAVGLLTLFFHGIPDQLEDAARLEGATRLQALRHVIVPLARPGIASVGALVFIEAYTEHFFTLFMTRGADGVQPTAKAIVYYIYNPFWALAKPNALAAAGLISLLPVVVVLVLALSRLDSWLAAWDSVT